MVFNMKILDMLKSKNKFEKIEGYCILVLIVGAVMLSAGIGLTILDPKGIPAITVMLGTLIAFLATVGLIVTWLIREMFGD